MTDESLIHSKQNQDVMKNEDSKRSREKRLFVPLTDIYESDDVINIVASMPGIDENSVEVTVENDIISVYGKVAEQKPSGMKLIYSEYVIGDYQRSFEIGDSIDKENISASVKNGELHVVLPKSAQARTRVIPVNVA